MKKVLGTIIALYAVIALSIPSALAFPQGDGYQAIRRQAFHIVTATTTTPSAVTSYIRTIVIVVNSATTATVIVRDKGGTPKTLYSSGSISAATTVSFALTEPILFTSGIDIVTTGTINMDVFITYYI